MLFRSAAPRKSDGWFLHALTGEEWLLRLKFRPARGAFKRELLDRQLRLAPLDQLKDVPLYGSEPRVKVKLLRSHFQEVELSVHRLAEIETPAFEAFLEKAVASFTRAIDRKESDPESTAPWSVDGREWHLSTRGFKPGRRVRWDRALVGRVISALEEASPEGVWDWNSQDSVKRRFEGIGMAWARLTTKQSRALELNLVGPKGRYNLAAVDRFGAGHEIRTSTPRFDTIKFSFLTDDDLSIRPFVEFLGEHSEAFRAAFAGSAGPLFS